MTGPDVFSTPAARAVAYCGPFLTLGKVEALAERMPPDADAPRAAAELRALGEPQWCAANFAVALRRAYGLPLDRANALMRGDADPGEAPATPKQAAADSSPAGSPQAPSPTDRASIAASWAAARQSSPSAGATSDTDRAEIASGWAKARAATEADGEAP
ncbi:MAG: hypothetical protein EOM91_15535 [Sphingobacteriia bacterium]|nr:hypothetical protein [Sphingobacteriia bacterium]